MSELKDTLERAHKQLCFVGGDFEVAKKEVIKALAIVSANESVDKVRNTRPDLKAQLGDIAGKIDRAFDLINEGSLDEAKAALCSAGEVVNTIMGEQE